MAVKPLTPTLLAFILIMASTVAVVLCPPWKAAELAVSPDSLEYSVAARRVIENGRYDLPLQGGSLPPRYPPWFSVLGLTPCYFLLGSDLGSGIFCVLIASLACVTFAFLIGGRLSGLHGACMASLLTLALPGYAYFSRQILADLPLCALTLAVAWLAIFASKDSWPKWQLMGTLAALCFGFKFTGIFVVAGVAAAAHGRHSFPRWLAAAAPIFMVAAAGAWYNYYTFGSAFRSGYHYWLPVPYDFPFLTFSLDNIPKNFRVALIDSGLLLLLMFAVTAPKVAVIRNHTGPEFKALLRFSCAVTVPVLSIYLLYFYTSLRFFLPLTVMFACLCGAALGGIAAKVLPRPRDLCFLLCWVCTGLIIYRAVYFEIYTPKLDLVRQVEAVTERGDVIISGIDSLFLEQSLLETGSRTIWPVSRRVEYASKVIAPRTLNWGEYRPNGPYEIDREQLKKIGAEDAVPETALEKLEGIRELVQKGSAVYLDVSQTTPEEVERFRALFELEEVSGKLRRLRIAAR
ncbi:MAG: hypothetical protein DCC75_03340 [Proteobacteria bacterium]|nr:MAG: hypothetical protein DCC75_03340 [Pseudomonadota bacterium]